MLTEREKQILQHVARGDVNKEIASALSISENTVKTHMKSVFSKLHARDRAEAVATALQRGFILPTG